jgi:hypothetical protein
MSDPRRKKLTIDAGKFNQACEANGLTTEQTGKLWGDLEAGSRKVDMALFGYIFAGLLLLVGGVIAIGSFVDNMGEKAAVAALIIASVGTFFAGDRFNRNDDNRIPAGVMYVLSTLTAWAAVGISITLWGSYEFKSSHLYLLTQALAIIGVSGYAWRRSGISFVAVPALIAGAAAVYSAVSLFTGKGGPVGFPFFARETFPLHASAMVAYGLLVNRFSFSLDGKTDEDFSFWGYLVGVSTFWFGFSMFDKGEIMWGLTGVIGVLSLATSVWFRRNIFAVAGVIAIISYIVHIADVFFRNNAGGLSALLIGGGVLGLLAVRYYRKNRESVDAWVRSLAPSFLRK